MGRTAETKEPKKTQTELVDELLERAAEELARAVEREDLGAIEGVKFRLTAGQKYWRLRSLLLSLRGQDEGAARAESQALKAEAQLVRANEASIVSRVEELERRVGEARTKGAGVRRLAKKRTRRPPPHSDQTTGDPVQPG